MTAKASGYQTPFCLISAVTLTSRQRMQRWQMGTVTQSRTVRLTKAPCSLLWSQLSQGRPWNLAAPWVFILSTHSGLIPFLRSFPLLGEGDTRGWHCILNHYRLLLFFFFFAVHITTRTNCIICRVQCKMKNVSPLVQKAGKICC